MSEMAVAWTVGVWGCALVWVLAYVRGWNRMRGVESGLATRARLGIAIVSACAAACALAWPLDTLSRASVLARMGQAVLLCLIAAPLLWLSCPLHIVARGLPQRLRLAVTRGVVRRTSVTPALQVFTSPLVVWFLYLSAFLTWLEPGFADVSMMRPRVHRIAALLLFGAALLFWQQITRCGPRRYTRSPLAARFAMLVAIEIANVVAGISIAYRDEPLYLFYARQGEIARTVAQQSLAGALTWVFGSLVYILSAVLVVNQVFQRDGVSGPHRPAGWDADDRFIAPGLEGRLSDSNRLSHDWLDY